MVPLTEEGLILVVPEDSSPTSSSATGRRGGAGPICLRRGHRCVPAPAVHPHQAGQPHPQYGGPVLQPPFFKPKLILETENTITTLAMAEAGIGITICPELFLKTIHVTANQASTEKLDLFPLTPPPSASWWWATARTATSPTLEAVHPADPAGPAAPDPLPRRRSGRAAPVSKLIKGPSRRVPPPRLKPGRGGGILLSSGAVDGPQLRGDPFHASRSSTVTKQNPRRSSSSTIWTRRPPSCGRCHAGEDDVPVLHLIRHGGNDAGDVVILPVLRIY